MVKMPLYKGTPTLQKRLALQYRRSKSRYRRNRILQKIKNLLYALVAMVRAYLTNRNIVIIAVRK